jgi:hypothetical protein
MKITIAGGVYLRALKEYKDEDDFVFLPGVPLDFTGHKSLGAHTIEFDAPDGFNPRDAQLAALHAKRKEVHDAFAAAVMQIDQRINSLLAIENAA